MKKFTAVILLIALAAIGTIFVIAQTSEGQTKDRKHFGKRGIHRGFGRHRMGRHKGRMMGRMFRQLDLTDAQKEKIQAIMKSSREEGQALRKQMRANRIELHNLSENGTFNESKVKQIAKKQGDLHAKMIIQRQKSKAQIHAVLTPAQKAKAAEMKANFKKMMKERKAKWAEKRKNKPVQ